MFNYILGDMCLGVSTWDLANLDFSEKLVEMMCAFNFS